MFSIYLEYQLTVYCVNISEYPTGIVLKIQLNHEITKMYFIFSTATDLAHHLRLSGELQQLSHGKYDPKHPRHHHLVISLLMTSADLSDQTKVRNFLYFLFFTL